MTPLPAAVLCLLALSSAVYAAPQTGQAAPPAPTIYGDAPDTGQFLPDAALLAKVNDRVIRVGEFVERYFNSYAEFRPRPDSLGRVEFLNNMINKEVMAHVARQAKRPESFEDRAEMRTHTERVLANVLFQRAVLDSIQEPAETEVRKTFDQLGYELRLGRLVFPSRDLAERARGDLMGRRTTWEDVAKRYAPPASDTLSRGDLGWLKSTGLPPAIATTVFDLRAGDFSPVLADEMGYTIYRATGRRELPKYRYEAFRRPILSQLRNTRINAQAERMMATLGAKLDMVHDTANIAWAASMFSPPLSVQGGNKPVVDINATLPSFSSEDTARVLSRWRDGQLSLGVFLAAYTTIPPVMRPNVTTSEALRHQADTFVLEPHLADLARERGLERDSMATVQIDKRREELMVEHLYQDSILPRVSVTSADRRKYYEKNLTRFMTPVTVTFAIFDCHSRSEADSLAARLKAGEKAEVILRADSLAGIYRGTIGERREDVPGTTYYKLLLQEMKPGQVDVQPSATERHFDVLQSLTYDPGHVLSYKETESTVDEAVSNQAAEKVLNAFLARHKKGMRIESHPERVMLVRLVNPTL